MRAAQGSIFSPTHRNCRRESPEPAFRRRGGRSESERKHSDESEGGGGEDGDDGRNKRRIGGMTSAKVTSQNGTKSGPPNNAHR